MTLPFKRLSTKQHSQPPSILCAGRILFGYLATTGLLMLSSQAYTQPAAIPLASDIDWVSIEELTPEQRSQIPSICCGMYVEPERVPQDGPPGTVDFLGDGLVSEDASIITVEGNVVVLQDDGSVQADSVIYDRLNGILNLTDNILIRQPGLLLTGATATVDQSSETSELGNASYVMHEEGIRGTAEIIVYTDADGIVTIDNGFFTRCEPGDNSWLVQGETIVLNQESGRGVARNLTLRVNDVPVFYAPWLSFPINDDRATGFLAPIMGSTRDGGFDFTAPYYLNLAPNYDATLFPRLITNRGVMLGAEGRYRGRNSRNLLELQYLPNDDLYDPATLTMPGTDSPPVADRWFLDYDNRTRLSRNWSGQVDYSAVSDEDYFQDLGNNGLNTTTRSYLYRSAGIRFQNENWRFQTDALGLQLIDPNVAERNKPYERLPRIDLEGSFALDSGLEYGFDAEYTAFDRNVSRNAFSQTQIDNGAMVSGQRLAITPEISFPWSSPGAFVTPSAKYKYASYTLDNEALGTDSNPDRGIMVGSLDSGLIFERPVSLQGTELTQTLEPRLFYLYSEYEDQSDIPIFDSSSMTFSFNQLFREDRFSGKDRIGDANQLTLALSSRVLDSRGREKASISAGQIIYFEDRQVTISNLPGQSERKASSALASELSLSLTDNWRLNSYVEWNTLDNSIDVGNFQFRYQSDINHILNFRYRYRDVANPVNAQGIDRRINQTDVSAVWPVSTNWGIIGRWNYDHANKRNLETIAGLEYNNCCWAVRVIARDWIDNDALFSGVDDKNSGVFIQFELKGFGSVLGGNVSGILNNGISGYREREYAQ